MADLNALKTQLKEQNQRLLSVTQDKARLEAKNKINQMKEEDGVGKLGCTSDVLEEDAREKVEV